jgi:hypothetical protein
MLACFSAKHNQQYKVVEKMLKKITFSISIIVECRVLRERESIWKKKPQQNIIMLWKGKYLCCAATQMHQTTSLSLPRLTIDNHRRSSFRIKEREFFCTPKKKRKIFTI